VAGAASIVASTVGAAQVAPLLGRLVPSQQKHPDHVVTYKGRQIRVTSIGDEEAVFIDGRRLHIMKLGEEHYLSAMCHYEFQKTPLACAYQAVDELRGAQLLPFAHHH
jgi:hypothetical protein